MSEPHIRIENRLRQAHRRGLVLIAIFACLYGAIGTRLVWLANQELPQPAYLAAAQSAARPDIVDRNGNTLAMDVPGFSVFAEPRRIVDLDEAVEGLVKVFPELDMRMLRQRLASNAAFAWVRRMATPAEKNALLLQGIPGIGFRDETRRLYVNGTTAAHLLGAVNIDNIGIAGIEKWIDSDGLEDLKTAGMQFGRRDLDSVVLSVDLRVQHALTDELRQAVEKFDAIAAAGLILDVESGEIIALASLPDFDPNVPADALKPDRINRINVGTYEMGSTFKAMTTAMALDSGIFAMDSVIDASQPLRFGRMTIRDYRGENRPLNIPEAFVHSSNIAMGRMAMAVGIEGHQAFLRSLGQFDRLTTELPESARPIVPSRWGEITTATAAFGHGVAVTPLQAAVGVAALINGGRLIRPTVIKGAPVESRIIGRDLVSPQTGEALRFMMRLNAEIGSARRADVAGYFIGGKTGTSEKVVDGRYSSDKVLTAFMGIAPADQPKYLFLTLLDEPKALPETYGFRTSGWNAVPVTGNIMRRALPMLIAPSLDGPNNPFPRMAALRAWGSERFVPQRAVDNRTATLGGSPAPVQ
ncbi:peptidoglycan D,D-transpeptidase FtsI family protein [Pannonibacter phragmitetus]|uniref:peptidoglycan D,D-transpeptidase FtsI family protein n=1 Tax=Pannonibacter phragmitetus TaxID=121719 RepID=UPI000F031462|nr:penicillin-binding protein 2 [Pannonibacter phragmitetus]